MITSIKELFRFLETPLPPNPVFRGTSNVAIYGAGNAGKDVFKILTDRGIPVKCFLDMKAVPGDCRHGVPILQPYENDLSIDERSSMLVIIAIYNAYVEIPPIMHALASHGYSQVITFFDFYNYFPNELGSRFWLTSRTYYHSLESIISECLSLWEDELSREIFLSTLEFRFTGDYMALKRPDPDGQYFPKDIPPWSGPIRFVDCGAFNGDTIASIPANSEVEAIAAFEPDIDNFIKLAQFVERNRATLPDDMFLWPCGVYSTTRQLSFSLGAGQASRISANGNHVVQCVALDQAIPSFKPTLIKMDVEGAEYRALLGARRLILRDRPGLAISLYHCPEHLWQIPLLVHQWNRHYSFYLRSHYHSGFDLVMYAAPR